MTEKDNKTIKADPTKDLFIHILTRDIELTRALVDLVDNSIDGARRLRRGDNFTNLWVKINASADRFEIQDNCGGIPADIARQYAFRFGRPKEMPQTPHSVGQFGVGMKRALFKLGDIFTIVSAAESSRFRVDINVGEWTKQATWNFEFSQLEEDVKVPESDQGTTITVTQLHPEVSSRLALESFIINLRNDIEAAHQESMDRGLSIVVNGIPLKYNPARLLNSKLLKPAFVARTYNIGTVEASVRIYAGISDSNPTEAGWYVFCNGRLVLEADQSEVTGWGAGQESKIPKYHNQFARFRGYIFFDSEDASILPWNTMKTGVDVDSSLYRAAKQEMVRLMRPVINALNQLDKEKQSEQQPLAAVIEKADLVKLTDLRPTPSFNIKAKAGSGPRIGNVLYARPIEQLERAMQVLEVSTYKEVGEQTFDYFYRLECE